MEGGSDDLQEHEELKSNKPKTEELSCCEQIFGKNAFGSMRE